jgi:hypothetical protein
MKIPNSKSYNGRTQYIKRGNSGNHLMPPFSKTHHFHIVAGIDRGNGYQEYGGLQCVLNNADVPQEAKDFVRAYIGEEIVSPIEDAAVQQWIKEVETYFADCYMVDDKKVISKEPLPRAQSKAVLYIQKYYPNYL